MPLSPLAGLFHSSPPHTLLCQPIILPLTFVKRRRSANIRSPANTEAPVDTKVRTCWYQSAHLPIHFHSQNRRALFEKWVVLILSTSFNGTSKVSLLNSWGIFSFVYLSSNSLSGIDCQPIPCHLVCSTSSRYQLAADTLLETLWIPWFHYWLPTNTNWLMNRQWQIAKLLQPGL
jgi:hypothetical protein